MTLLYGQTEAGELVPLRCDSSGRILTIWQPDPTGTTKANWLEGVAPGPIGIRYPGGKELALSPSGALDLTAPVTIRNGSTSVLSLSAAGDLVVPGNITFGSSKLVQGQTAKVGNILLDSPVPSTNVRCLDYYEEGSWTPSISGATVAGTPVYGVRYGRYTRIGNLCYCMFRIALNNKADMDGQLVVSGFPFRMLQNANDLGIAQIVNWVNVSAAANIVGLSGYITPAPTDQLRTVFMSNAAGQTAWTIFDASRIANTFAVNGAIYYSVS